MRINEDYMDVIDRQDVADSAEDILDRQLKDELFCHQIDVVLNTMKPEKLDFENASNAIYPVDNTSIKDVISKLSKLYKFSSGINLNWMDTSRVTSMINLFSVVSTTILNVDISRWDVSNVTDMSYMFIYMIFNGDISKWDVSSVRDMACMFNNSSFNSDISGWDVRNLKSCQYMFADSKFNQDISGWDVRSLKICQYMFADSEFNQDISGWDVSHINSMDRMFTGSKMYRDLSSWDVTYAAYKHEMFTETPMQNKREWYPKGCMS